MLWKISKKNSKVNIIHSFSNITLNIHSSSHLKFSQWNDYIIKQLLTVIGHDVMLTREYQYASVNIDIFWSTSHHVHDSIVNNCIRIVKHLSRLRILDNKMPVLKIQTTENDTKYLFI